MGSDRSTGPTAGRLFTWRTALCENADLTASEKHVGITLALFMNEMGGSAFPGAPLLARMTSLSERTVRTALRALVDKGWLEIVEHGGIKGQRRRANHYEARTPATFAGLDGNDPSNPRRAPLQPATATPATGSPQLSKNSSGSRASIVNGRPPPTEDTSARLLEERERIDAEAPPVETVRERNARERKARAAARLAAPPPEEDTG